ncbi:methyl-accepting chemotaxis protein [Solibacillus sp. FSL W7-1436]|uniref:methyl-accepting chemotaxis protein n=1 Tax=Solibacillus sp. FSL W7-1436 TaxID=2921705 RepID=UPI0030F61F7F
MHTKLQAVVDTMELYQATFPEDACIIVASNEEVVGYLPGKFVDLKINVGLKMVDFRGTVTERALTTKRFLREEKGPERFGFAYISSAQPIFDGKDIIGVVSAIISNEKMDSMRQLATELSSAVEEMTATNEELTAASMDVSNRLDGLVTSTEVMTADIGEINQMVDLVKGIASKSQILGLNASIEAARSGEHGRGFAVVAKEIQKMAQNSKESAEKIAAQLNNIRVSIADVSGTTSQIAAFTEQFATSMHELNDAYGSVNGTAEKLLEISEIK